MYNDSNVPCNTLYINVHNSSYIVLCALFYVYVAWDAVQSLETEHSQDQQKVLIRKVSGFVRFYLYSKYREQDLKIQPV